MKKFSLFALLAACVFAGLQSSHAQSFVGLQTNGTSLNVYATPTASPTSYTVSGLGTDTLVDIDFFTSSNGQLYGMSNTGTLYTLAQATTTTYSATVVSNVGAIPGGPVAIDFNPSANRLRVFTSTTTSGSNTYRLTVGTGNTATPDGMLTFAASDVNSAATPSLIGAAYSSNNPGTTITSLYSIDRTTNSLILHSTAGTFNTLNTVGPLMIGATPFTATANTGFDITSINNANVAYISSNTSLYTVNLGTGAMTLAANLSGSAITDIAFVPEPGTYAMLAMGGLVLVAYTVRRRSQAAA